jgi:CDP-diacylglycerol--glycerol-3-phosphate 3-phosphatidyltransferase
MTTSGAAREPVTPAVAAPAVAAPGASAWNVANALTLLRLLLVPVFGWLLLAQDGRNGTLRALAAAAFAVAVVTDRIDGELARRRGLVTDVGKIADPIADKALMGMALVGLSVLGELAWWVTVVVLVREIGITLLRFVVIKHGVMPASRGGKAKTVLQALAVTLFLLPLPAAWRPVAAAVLAVAVTLTVVTGLDYVLQAWRLVRTSPRTMARREARNGAGRARDPSGANRP